METLKEAISALYSPCGRNEDRRRADEWLQQFLHSDQAWPLSLALLRENTSRQHDHITSAETLFCARSLHILLRISVCKTHKKQKSHVVLTKEDWVGMREALLELTRVYAADPGNHRLVLTQLALAVSTLAMKMEHWPAESVVTDLAEWFRARASVESGAAELTAMVEILRVLPEEAQTKLVSIRPERRAAVLRHLIGQSRVALSVLRYACTVKPPLLHLQASALEAFSVWIELGGVPPTLIIASPLLPHAVELLAQAQQLQQSGGCLEAILGGGVWAALDAAAAVAMSATTAAASSQEGAVPLQKQLLEDLFIKLCPRVGAEHLALRESLAVLAHAFITMQKPFLHTGQTARLDVYLQTLAIVAQNPHAPHETVLAAMQPWSSSPHHMQGFYGVDEMACALALALADRLSSPIDNHSNDNNLEDGPGEEAGDAQEVASLIGDLAEACGVVVATSLFQHLDVLMRKVGSTPGDAATWRRAVGLLRALQAAVPALKKQGSDPTVPAHILRHVSTALLPPITGLHLSSVSIIQWQSLATVVTAASALIGALVTFLNHAQSQLWQTVVAALCTSLRECLAAAGSSSRAWDDELPRVIFSLAVACIKTCQQVTTTTLEECDGTLRGLMDLYQLALQVSAAHSATPTAIASHKYYLSSTVHKLLRSTTCLLPKISCRNSVQSALLQALDPVACSLEAHQGSLRTATPGEVIELWKLCQEIVKCAATCRTQHSVELHEPFDMMRAILSRLWSPVVGALKPPGGALISRELIDQVLEVVRDGIQGAASLEKNTTQGADPWLLELLPQLINLLIHVFQQQGAGLVCLTACIRTVAGTSTLKGTLDSSHIQRYDASVERGLWSIGEAVLQVHSMVAQGGSSKSLHVAVEFFPLMRDCMLVPLPQFVSADKLQTLMNILHNCLSGSAGDEARVALGFAKFVFTFPTMPINAAGPRAQLQKQLAELVDAMLSSPGWSGGSGLMLKLLEAANGAMPPSHVIDVATTLHSILGLVGDVRFRILLEEALRMSENFPRSGTSDTAKLSFVTMLLSDQCKGDVRYFKRIIKGFCGGKKKGVVS